MKLEIVKTFGPYKKPTEQTIPKFKEIQVKVLGLALTIDKLCPESDEKRSALSALTMVRMFANASIAINENVPEEKV